MVSFILPGNSATGGYEVANSVRLNNADNAYFSQTPSASSGTTFTYSMWIKRGRIGLNGYLIRMVAADNSESDLVIESDKIRIQEYEGTSGTNKWKYITNRLFRDASAWYHIMYVVDTNNGTASDRVQLYINGVRETSFSTATNPSSGATSALSKGEARTFGGKASAGSFDGYMAECVYVDGTAKSTTDFGEFDEDSPTIWKPIDVSSMSLGSTGWYLDFEDSSSLGNDASGSNNWTSNNLAAIDQTTDTCTNNFATWNPLVGSNAGGSTEYYPTLEDGNTKATPGNAAQNSIAVSTIGVSSGKWYAEFILISESDSGADSSMGVTDDLSAFQTENVQTSSQVLYSDNGSVHNRASSSSSGTSFSTGDIIGVALDLDNNNIYFSKNGTFINSGDPTSGATGTGAYSLGSGTNEYFFMVGDSRTGGSSVFRANFGNPSASISSGNSDSKGHGNFEYAVPSGYFALCTKNLAEFG